ncbi:MAG: type II toxin-antitoxin system Phd/YefM family antitoxin [Acidobacteriota bacterium]
MQGTEEWAVNVAEAKRRFSDLLGRVAYGKETILITRRGRPMARLVPVRKVESGENELAALRGWLDDEDPFFEIVEGIVSDRGEHRPRVLPMKGQPQR